MPAYVELSVYRGDTGAWTLDLWNDSARTDPFDLTGATVAAQIRERFGLVVTSLECTVTLPNTVDVVLPADSSELLMVAPSRWDLQAMYPDGTVQTLCAGPVRITADVTDVAGGVLA